MLLPQEVLRGRAAGVGWVVVLTLLLTAVTVLHPRAASAIVGGDQASDPSVVQVWRRENVTSGPLRYTCSGVLVDPPGSAVGTRATAPEWVLTAQHCVVADMGTYTLQHPPQSMAVFVGGEWRDVVEIKARPGYTGEGSYKNDMAALKLGSQAPASARPASLATYPQPDYDAYTMVAWGPTNPGGPDGQFLMALTCEGVPAARVYPPGAAVAGCEPTGYTAAGDSGGAVYAQLPDGSFALVGVVAAGSDPTQYAPVTTISPLDQDGLSWLQSVVKPTPSSRRTPSPSAPALGPTVPSSGLGNCCPVPGR